MRFVTPRDHSFVGIREGRFEVRSWQIRPLKAIRFRNATRDGVIGDGLFAFPIHRVADCAAEEVVVTGEGLGIEARDLLGDELAVGVVSEGGDAGGVGGGGLTIECFVSIKQAFSHATPHLSSYSSTILLSIRINSLTFIVLSIIASSSKSNTS